MPTKTPDTAQDILKGWTKRENLPFWVIQCFVLFVFYHPNWGYLYLFKPIITQRAPSRIQEKYNTQDMYIKKNYLRLEKKMTDGEFSLALNLKN